MRILAFLLLPFYCKEKTTDYARGHKKFYANEGFMGRFKWLPLTPYYCHSAPRRITDHWVAQRLPISASATVCYRHMQLKNLLQKILFKNFFKTCQ